MGDIAISNGVRSNLMALQSTAKLMESTQSKLSTGNRVNSALDNPANFFTASAMNNRSSDLGNLLDSMKTAVNTLKAADAAITSITKLVQSAQGTARQALQDATGEKQASIVGGTSLDGAASKSAAEAKTLVGDLGFDAGDKITVKTTKDGVETESTFTISSTSTVKDLVDSFNDGMGGKVAASITSDGKLSIEAADGATLDLKVTDASDGVADNTLQDLFGATATINGEEDQAVAGAGGSDIAALVAAATAAQTAADTAQASADLTDAAALQATADLTDAAALQTTADATDAAALQTTWQTLQAAADLSGDPADIAAADAAHVDYLAAAADDTAAASAAADDAAAAAATAADTAAATAATAATTAATAVTDALDTDATAESQTIAAPAGETNETREKLAQQFNDILSQINGLAQDADFNGINLLQGDNLKVTFNEKTGANENSLTIKGVQSDSSGLGLNSVTGGFQDTAEINASLEDIKGALTTLRQQASEFGSNLTTVQTRQDFTNSMINVLQSGASDLTLADTNAEGANMLALQTRQSLATTTMGMASQADQSVLSFLR